MMRYVIACAMLLAVAPVAAAEGDLPEWVRSIAKYWGEGAVSDSEFFGAIEYLINNGHITMPGPVPGPIMERDGDPGNRGQFPYVVDSALLASDAGVCSMVLEGIRIDGSGAGPRYSLEATTSSDVPGAECRLLTHHDAGSADTALAAILLHHTEYDEPTVLYRLWEPREGAPGTWTFSPLAARSDGTEPPHDPSWDALDSVELLYYEIRHVTFDHAETVFFGNAQRYSEYLDPLVLE